MADQQLQIEGKQMSDEELTAQVRGMGIKANPTFFFHMHPKVIRATYDKKFNYLD